MSNYSQTALKAQQDRNNKLIANSKYMRSSVTSHVLPLQIDVGGTEALDDKQIATLDLPFCMAYSLKASDLAEDDIVHIMT